MVPERTVCVLKGGLARRNSTCSPSPRRRRGSTPTMHNVVAPAAPSDVFVLDFDGVLVDSEPEVSRSALAAAAQQWPSVCGGMGEEERRRVLHGLRQTRPVLVRGYESMVMARLLVERPDAVTAILGDWAGLLPVTLERWGEDWEQIQLAFEAHRASWMQGDRQAWLDNNQPYAGVKDALGECDSPFYICSSKAGHRVSTLLSAQLGIDIPIDSPRLFHTLIPPEERKAAALREICERPLCQAPHVRLHFVDDRLDTLRAVQADPGLAGRWALYLAAWGYCTAAELAAAAADPSIRVLQRPAFLELLRWGIVMEVDDGCAPDAEEVAATIAATVYRPPMTEQK